MQLDYELIDTGNGDRLERWGTVRLIRPDPQIIWQKHLSDAVWHDVDARFTEKTWQVMQPLPDPWILSYGDVKLKAMLTSFKHTGVFPEQADNWQWMLERLNFKLLNLQPRILNLFAYTGAASMILAKAGCAVTHVDASKPALDWAAENQKLSGLAPDSIRWMLEDAVKFVRREVKRGAQYDGILLDPPAFGHGPSGSIWKFNRDLPGLLRDCAMLLSPDAAFLLVNGYATNSSSIALGNLLEDTIKDRGGNVEHGELLLSQRDGRRISTGIFSRWSR